MTDAPSWFADGRTLLLGARSQPQGPGRNFFRLDLDSGAITKVNAMPNDAVGQQWVMSPDGETVYTTGRDRDTETTRVVALSLSSGQSKTISPTGGLVALSPDGRTLAVSTGRTARLMDTQGGDVRTLFDSGAPSMGGITSSSDGRHVLFVRSLNGNDSDYGGSRWTGGEPSPTGIRGRQLREIRGGPNGVLTYTAGSPKQAELWALDNLLPMLKASR